MRSLHFCSGKWPNDITFVNIIRFNEHVEGIKRMISGKNAI
jgi:hypothetical protein